MSRGLVSRVSSQVWLRVIVCYSGPGAGHCRGGARGPLSTPVHGLNLARGDVPDRGKPLGVAPVHPLQHRSLQRRPRGPSLPPVHHVSFEQGVLRFRHRIVVRVAFGTNRCDSPRRVQPLGIPGRSILQHHDPRDESTQTCPAPQPPGNTEPSPARRSQGQRTSGSKSANRQSCERKHPERKRHTPTPQAREHK